MERGLEGKAEDGRDRNTSKKIGAHTVEIRTCMPELRRPRVNALDGSGFNFFRNFCGKTIFPIIGDRPINDRTTIETFPGVEDQEKVRETFQHHQTFALRTTHDCFLPQDES